ncbi:MAG: TAXI family TRAP transporter solute-binding subunit [Salinarimonadaceae bacterium]|nr:MAG: TAXI family TRAP transporter solute-binding subunit [Salinarimonadaceae bacterium]
MTLKEDTILNKGLTRRTTLTGLLGGVALAIMPGMSGRLHAQSAPIGFMTAGQGSAFLPYGQGVGAWLASSDTPIDVLESAGSNDNLKAVDSDPSMTGMAFLGSAASAIAGTGPFDGAPTGNVRALFPTYNTSFQIAALRDSGLSSFSELDGKRVGVGPAGGPAENFFRAAQTVAGIETTIVNGSPAELGDMLVAGDIDALWQGAIAPIPALTAVQSRADAVVFGLTEEQVAGMLEALPYLARQSIAPGTYDGQTEEIVSVAGWNVVIAHVDMPEETAYALTRNVLAAEDPASQIHPFAASTRAEYAPLNTVVPYHPGAIRALREFGVTL